MMIVSSLDELHAARLLLDGRLGLVPTMGYLHEGHLSLARRAREECDRVAASIFVNPTQFGPTEDLSKYPRDLDRDLSLLEAAGVDLVWTPDNETMYPPGFSTWVEVEGLTKPLEGAARPGHFRGVTTVVAKLFNAVQPQAAYFGQKDAQQAAVVRKMTRDLNFPVEIVVCPTVRETDGLAMSSRNSYLSPEERKSAVVLFRALTAAREAFERGERDAESLRKVMSATLASEPRARTQYVSCADYDTLEELGTVTGKALLSMAVFIGKTRLIDNFVVGS
ncbi:MAG: pantoate--beta-alanine ligase [Anaerolineae bacterium CFX3]|nr:pantoate--beta-alanine ligase [Anaerolineae bacterium CFX3]MCQ3945880.1 pantoate--beta-alanine ligase [Anaerolineae bacterium]RIK26935.1 MAG: pantoate--beta-alanine ligase [Anaerolineae bacterium]